MNEPLIAKKLLDPHFLEDPKNEHVIFKEFLKNARKLTSPLIEVPNL